LWGCNESSQLGLGSSNNKYEPVQLPLKKLKPVSVACGSHFSVLLTSNGEVMTWGKGESGQLGLGDSSNGHIPQRVQTIKKKKISNIYCGSKNIVAVSG
jgi:alpha-tubulin suppressor-like RCC1 family protein